jgi:hypothetical protein
MANWPAMMSEKNKKKIFLLIDDSGQESYAKGSRKGTEIQELCTGIE